MNIAILGCGTVGSGTVKLLMKNEKEYTAKAGEPVVIKKLLERHPEKALALGVPAETIVSSFDEILADDSIETVVELIGGRTWAYEYTKQCLKAGKNVVTANKDMLAEYLGELSALAHANGAMLMYEASVGGAIPVIGSVSRSLAANRISRIYGILNGTTNYILTRMCEDAMPYEEALADSQRLGYAEADPTNDVRGYDSARKLAVLASLVFGRSVHMADIGITGIEGITRQDILDASAEGKTIKLVAEAYLEGEKLCASVKPVKLPLADPLASVNDCFNAVCFIGDACGEIMLYGRGAGSLPTASAVVGDIIEICRRRHDVVPENPLWK
ncbi:MAG: homoserine dehydrogenase [Clostridia bacterium]|nr:homoserine dehydrogenase [Clostridia bacterium]